MSLSTYIIYQTIKSQSLVQLTGDLARLQQRQYLLGYNYDLDVPSLDNDLANHFELHA